MYQTVAFRQELDLWGRQECIDVFLASKPGFPAMLLALSPGLQAVLLCSGQVGTHLLMGMKQEFLHHPNL